MFVNANKNLSNATILETSDISRVVSNIWVTVPFSFIKPLMTLPVKKKILLSSWECEVWKKIKKH